jgi:hypothetical protein
MKSSEKQPSPATKRKRSPANNLSVTRPGQGALTVAEAAQTDDVLVTLRALSARLATAIDQSRNKRVTASLAGRLADVASRIDALERADRGQQRGQPASNEAVRRSLSEAAARGGGIRDELL